MQGSQFTDAEALVVLVTIESFFFAVLSVVAAVGRGGKSIPALPMRPVVLGSAAVVVLSVIAVGALAAWWGVFVDHWPCGWRRSLIACVIALGIAAQPAFAALVTLGMRARR